MVLFQARIPLAIECRSEVLRSLRRILGETRAWPGCLSCRLCTDTTDTDEEGASLLLMESWSDLASLSKYVGSDTFRVVLSALDYACEPPEVRFDTVADTRGMGFILACRQSGAAT